MNRGKNFPRGSGRMSSGRKKTMTAKIKIERVLIALDGSQRSLETIARLEEMDSFRRCDITLFHVFAGLPAYLLDAGDDPSPLLTEEDLRSWQSERRNEIARWLGHARNRLLRSGFQEGRVRTKVASLNLGVARDILAEARSGYDALVIRRRGMSKMASMIVGGVSSKLLEASTFIPILVEGKMPFGGKILIAIDGSENSIRAVEFVGAMTGGYCNQIVLAHVTRRDMSFDILGGKPVETLSERAQMELRCSATARFTKAADILQGYGFSRKQLRFRFLPDKSSRSETISHLASEEGCTVIAAGRKGQSMVEEFSLGTVTRKLLYLAQDRSFWIVP